MTTPATLRKQELLQLLGAIMQRRLVSDYEGLRQYLAEDVVAELPLSRRLFMWAGKHQGLAAVIEALRLQEGGELAVPAARMSLQDFTSWVNSLST